MKRVFLVFCITLLLNPFKLKVSCADSLSSSGSLGLNKNISVTTLDLYNLNNNLIELESLSKEKIVKYINGLDKDNVLIDITAHDDNGNYYDFDTICAEILNTQVIKDNGSTNYRTYYGESTLDSTEEKITVSGANENNLSAGTRAWVDGHYIVGNGTDNKMYYDKGYQDGLTYVSNNSSYEIIYTYHEHGDGYCNQTPRYHQHTGSASSGGGCYTVGRVCGARIRNDNKDPDGNGGYIETGDRYYCAGSPSHSFGSRKPGSRCPRIVGYGLGCGKDHNTIESYYCSLPEGTITSAKVEFY